MCNLILAQKLYYNVEQDATIKFWQALHFVGQVNLRNEVRRLSDRAFEQLSNLIVAPLTSREVQVRTRSKDKLLGNRPRPHERKNMHFFFNVQFF